MKKYVENFKVVENEILNANYSLLKLKYPKKLPPILPGQFVEVKVDNSPNTFLRRPISVHDVDENKNEMHLLIEKRGEGTKVLYNMQQGQQLNLIYPLGNTWKSISSGYSFLLIGGGVGIAPLLYTAKILKNQGKKVTTLVGGRSKANLLRLNAYKALGEVYTTTEDSSHGETGFVTQHSIMKDLKAFDAILTCGPEPMMKAVAKIAKEQNVNCEVSLENTMACGIGACLVCVQDTVNGHKCVCTEGPIFNTNDLKW